MAIISAVIITNESIQFWKEIQNLNFIGWLLLLFLITGFINTGIKLKIMEN